MLSRYTLSSAIPCHASLFSILFFGWSAVRGIVLDFINDFGVSVILAALDLHHRALPEGLLAELVDPLLADARCLFCANSELYVN
jgi:hypothetical protein